MQGIPYVSAIDTSGDQETIITLALHLILILIEYKPPSIENLRYLIQGGHPTLNKVYNNFIAQAQATTEDAQATATAILEDLTTNEHYRLLRVVHGKINLDPLYKGLAQYYQNIITC